MKKFLILFSALMLSASLWAQNFDYEYRNQNFFGLATDTVTSIDDTVSVAFDLTQVNVLPFAHPMPATEGQEPVAAVAPRKDAQAAADCPIDSIKGYDEEDKLSSLTLYTYDNNGRTTETAMWQITDGVKKGVSKTETQYDAAGRITYNATWDWNESTNDWKGKSKTESTYDASGRKTVDMSWTWDAAANDWKGVTKNEYTFNAAGKYTEWVVYTWADGDWQGKTRITYTYNEAGKQLETVEYTYDTTLGAWVGSTKSEYTYDEAGHNLLALTSTWDKATETWVPTKKYEYAFDEAGNQTLDSYYTAYDPATDTWTGNYLKIYSYNSAKKKLLDEQYTWDAKNATWKGSAKTENEYNAAGKTTLTLKYKWTNGAWIYNTKTETEYDSKNREINKASYSWKNEAWNGTSRTSTTYNAAGKKETVIAHKWQDGEWVNNTLTGYSYSGSLTTDEYTATWNGTEWINATRKTYEYNAAGKKEADYTFTWNDTDWQYATRTLYTYDAKGVAILTHTASWTDGKWVMTSMKREDFEYDEAGRTTLDATYTCAADSVWKGNTKDEWTYNEAGTMIYRAAYKFGTTDWIPDYKVEWVYDANGRKTLEQRHNYNNDQWYPTYKYEYDYDSKGHEILSMMYTGSGTEWVGSFRTERTYNESDLQTQDITYTWTEGNWVGLFRTTYTYDAQKRITERILERFGEGEWGNDTRNLYEFNAKGQETLTNEYQWLNEQWVYKTRSEKEYDAADSKLRTELAATYTDGVVQTYSLNRYHYTCDPRFYLIRFLDYNGTVLQQETMQNDEMPEYKGKALTRETTEYYTYTFKGWKPEIAAVTEATDYVADYDSTAITHTIRFLNYNGAELQNTEMTYGEMPEYTGTTPTREANEYYTYTFKGWEPAIELVSIAADYTATFDSTAITHTVRFLNYNGAELQNTEMTYGKMPEYTGTTPTRDANDYYTYTFKGWEPAIELVSIAADYTATFDSTAITHTVRFLNYNGTELQNTEMTYGEMPEYTGTTPEKAANEYYTYTFKGWEPAITLVSTAADYVADFDSTAITYTIRFLNYNGAELQNTEMTYGEMPEYIGETPKRDATEDNTYTFKGWTPEITAVTGAADYVAEYDIAAITYTIRFLNYDGTELQNTQMSLGEMPAYTGTTPERETDSENYYVFVGWTPTIKAVTGDNDYTARFEGVPVSTLFFTISFYNYNDTLLGTSKTHYGEIPVYEGETPTRESTEDYDYTFIGWTPELQPATGIASYTAVFEEHTKGTTTDLSELEKDGTQSKSYNILGQPVDSDYKGIVITNGKKTIKVK